MQKYAHPVELEKCCRTHIFLQNFVLIQPRTSPPKNCKNNLQKFASFASLIPIPSVVFSLFFPYVLLQIQTRALSFSSLFYLYTSLSFRCSYLPTSDTKSVVQSSESELSSRDLRALPSIIYTNRTLQFKSIST